MPPPDNDEIRAHLEALCEKLLEAGWLKEFFFAPGRGLYGVKWTPKGIERARWVSLIGDDLDLGPKGLTALLVICRIHAPHED